MVFIHVDNSKAWLVDDYRDPALVTITTTITGADTWDPLFETNTKTEKVRVKKVSTVSFSPQIKMSAARVECVVRAVASTQWVVTHAHAAPTKDLTPQIWPAWAKQVRKLFFHGRPSRRAKFFSPRLFLSKIYIHACSPVQDVPNPDPQPEQ